MKRSTLAARIAMKVLAAAWYALSTSFVFSAGPKWESGSDDHDSTKGYISICSAGNEDFGAVVEAHLRKGRSISQVYLSNAWTGDPALQAQLLALLKQIAPEQLGGALRSAGNMHNPKVTQLKSAVCRAFLQTKLVRGLDQVLKSNGMAISKVILEKLMIFRSEEGPRFDAIIWLIVSSEEAGPMRTSGRFSPPATEPETRHP